MHSFPQILRFSAGVLGGCVLLASCERKNPAEGVAGTAAAKEEKAAAEALLAKKIQEKEGKATFYMNLVKKEIKE